MDDIPQPDEALAKTPQYYTLLEVSRRLLVPYWKIQYAVKSGKVPKPFKLGKNYVYAEQDITNLRNYMLLEGNL